MWSFPKMVIYIHKKCQNRKKNYIKRTILEHCIFTSKFAQMPRRSHNKIRLLLRNFTGTIKIAFMWCIWHQEKYLDKIQHFAVGNKFQLQKNEFFHFTILPKNISLKNCIGKIWEKICDIQTPQVNQSEWSP